MSTVVEERVADGGDTISIEVDDAPEVERLVVGEREATRGDDDGDHVTRPFHRGMAIVRSCANVVAETMKDVASASRPSEFEVEFAVKFASEVGAFVAKTGTEGQLKVRMKWVRGAKDG